MGRFMIAISNDMDVIESFRYEGNINGELFSQFARDSVYHIFRKGNNQKKSCFWKMETSSRIAKCPWSKPHQEHISAIFQLFRLCLRKDAVKKKIKGKTYEHFYICFTNTLRKFPSDIIDQTTASISKWIDAFIKMKGQRTKY